MGKIGQDMGKLCSAKSKCLQSVNVKISSQEIIQEAEVFGRILLKRN